jgi:alginate O-acetyltransferase complex protein AlgI
MNFNTYIFILVYLPIVLIIFYFSPARFRIPVILVSSLIFYGASGVVPLIFLVLAVVWGWGTAILLGKRKFSVWISVSFPLLTLFLFKYLDFSLGSIGAGGTVREFFLPVLSVTLPAGISFYTFQIVAYSIDRNDGRIGIERNPVMLGAFISFFPQLIAGPILRYEQIKYQFDRIATAKAIVPDFSAGLKFVSIGLFAKIYFADIPRTFQERIVTVSDPNSLDSLFSVFTYSFVIYFDFWSYSLIAIGLGRLFSVDLPRNFLEPYLSPNPREFWRRWHVTLSYWLRDYVYLKLGGNRAYVRNIVIVFLAVGLWHGAGWNFIVWGAYHAAFVILYHFVAPVWNRAWLPVQVGTTFVIVSLGWPLFYLDLGEYLRLVAGLIVWDVSPDRIYGSAIMAYMAVVMVWTFFMREDRWLFNERCHRFFDSPFLHGLLFSLAMVSFSFGKTFIYFVF